MYLAEVLKLNNKVIRVLFVEDGIRPEWSTESEHSVWIETSQNTNKRFAAVGDKYMSSIDAFIRPKPYESWVLDETIADWVSPVPHPDPDPMVAHLYYWDEANLQWVFIEKEPPAEE